MSFYVGTGTTLQVGKEASFAAGETAMTELINLSSESLKVGVEKGDEGSLLASKTAQARDVLGINVEGNIAFILRPEFAGRIFQAAMGSTDNVEVAESGFWNHTLTLCDAKAELPTLAFTIDRKAAIKTYTGCTIGTLSIDVAAGDYVKGSIDVKGHDEIAAERLGEVAGFTIPSYRCVGATFSLNGRPKCISNASLKIDNALEDAPKLYGSATCNGLLKGQPLHGLRSVTMDIEVPYDEEIEALKASHLRTDATGQIDLKFAAKKDEEEYTIEIQIPNLSISDIAANVGGAGLINASISGEALTKVGAEPITVIIHDKTAGSY